MAISFSLILLLLTTTVAVSARHRAPISTPAPSPPTTRHRRPVSTAYQTRPQLQPEPNRGTHLNTLIDALGGDGEFTGWANLLSTADPSFLPLTATFFVPGNDAAANLSVILDVFLIAYHIVPQRLTFSDLRRLATRTRLPTALPDKYIVITDNSPENFTVDGSRITDPDIFVNSVFTVHGVGKLFDYSVYGDGRVPLPPVPENKNSSLVSAARRRPPKKELPVVSGGEVDVISGGEVDVKSGGSCLCSWASMIFQISCSVLGIYFFVEI